VALLLAWVVGDGELTGRVVAAAGIVVTAVALTWAPGTAICHPERSEGGMPTGMAPSLRSG